MGRFDVLHRIEAMDPATEFTEILRLTSTLEFPWDMSQALSFALFRTYAVPSIGGLLARTGEFTERTQKRYDDTALILDAVLEHGSGSTEGRTAIRRMNQMHRFWEVGQDDLRYVLSTFVVSPIRWIDAYGWRELVDNERIAMANYYRELGRHMGITGIPETWQEFAAHLDAYEREHFAFDPGARRVADATLDLFATFPMNRFSPGPVVRQMSYSLMDDALLDAFRYPHPKPAVRALVRAGLRARGGVVRRMPPRREPFYARQLPQIRSYPHGYDLGALGTFPAGAPAPAPAPAGGSPRAGEG